MRCQEYLDFTSYTLGCLGFHRRHRDCVPSVWQAEARINDLRRCSIERTDLKIGTRSSRRPWRRPCEDGVRRTTCSSSLSRAPTLTLTAMAALRHPFVSGDRQVLADSGRCLTLITMPAR